MTMPLKMKQEFLSDAEFILQIEIVKLEISPESPGDSVIHAKVVKQFQGSTRLNQGDSITIFVTTYRWDAPPPPGDCYSYVEDLEKARFLEVYFDSDAQGRFSAIDTQAISTPSNEPYYLATPAITATDAVNGFWSRLKRWLLG